MARLAGEDLVISERDIVATTPIPRTRASLASDVRKLGVTPGDVLLVHCSLSAMGWVAGGAAAVILGLRDAVTATGTLIMPTQSAQLSDPSGWSRPAIPSAWHDLVRATMPAFDPRTTPSRGMGVVAEEFRTGLDVLRSPHPTCSFAAFGPLAQEITAQQPLEDPFGEESPVARLSRAGADILLLGVGFERCTAFHLAERRAWPDRPLIDDQAPLVVDGKRQWVSYRMPPLDEAAFSAAGRFVIEAGIGRTGCIGSALSHLLPMAKSIEHVVERWRGPPDATAVHRL